MAYILHKVRTYEPGFSRREPEPRLLPHTLSFRTGRPSPVRNLLFAAATTAAGLKLTLEAAP